MKCPKCGCEFEGNFCPNCGAVAGEVTRCPVCGKERADNERFCSGCGYAYEKPEQKKEPEQKSSTNAPAMLYKILTYAPLALFAAMAVLAFLFSIAPAVSGWFNISAYGLLSDDSIDGMQGTALFLLIAELLFLIAAAASIFFIYKFKSTDDNRLCSVLKLSVAASAIYYLILLIIGIVMCAQVAAYDDGFGAFSAGACPILFIVFSILFGIAEAAAVIFKNQLIKKYPQLKEDNLIPTADDASASGAATGTSQTAIKKERAPLSTKTKKRITVFAVLLAVAIVAVIIIVVVCNSLSNIFRIGKVSQINLGDSKSQVVAILGEPDEHTETTYSYYSNNYNKILKEINSFDGDDIDDWDDLFAAAEQEAELYEELESITYQRIDITFSDGAVTAIYLDANCCDSTDSNKTPESVTVLSGYFLQDTTQISTTTTITYEAEFTDGSYAKATATAHKNNSDTDKKNITATWSDKLYSEYSGKVEVIDASSGYYIDENTLYIVSDGTKLSSIKSSTITYIIICEGVTTIDDGAFNDYTKLTNISVNSGNSSYKSIDGNLYSFDGTVLLQYALGKTETSFIIPDSVSSIGSKAFKGCKSLTSVTLPDSVTSIGSSAFSYCNSLTSVIIGSGVTSIGSYAFYCCTSLESITIPENVAYIDNHAFYECTNLNEIYFNAMALNTDGLNSMSNIFSNVGTNNEGATLIIGSNVTKIPDELFYNSSIANIVFEENSICESIGFHAFSNCDSLTSIAIPDSVTSIGQSAFYDCDSLTSVTIGNGVTSIGTGAFEECTALTSITIPDSVTSIGGSAFYNCTALESVTIGSGVTSIGHYAFEGCTSLTSVIFKNTSGWYRTTTSGATSGSTITKSSIQSSSTMAKFLRDTYSNYYWYRSDN